MFMTMSFACLFCSARMWKYPNDTIHLITFHPSFKLTEAFLGLQGCGSLSLLLLDKDGEHSEQVAARPRTQILGRV